jgi:hypothetical protein
VEGPVVAYRVARESYGPLNPPVRVPGSDPFGWSRFDAPERTIYAAEDEKSAFIEALSWARQELADHHKTLAKTAEYLGISIQELSSSIEEEWLRNSSMAPSWVPTVWRDGRRIYQLTFDSGSWVDIMHSDTLHALSNALQPDLQTLGIPLGLTLSEVTSANRALTTLIATWLREEVTLDDGTQPMGIRFQTKHGRIGTGEGLCWAYWMRRRDAGLSDELVTVDEGRTFESDYRPYAHALAFHNISSR